jgi:hypothetical protein
MAALVAGPMTAGMAGEMSLPTVAAIELPALSGRATTQNGRHGPTMREGNGVPEARVVGGPMTAENLRQFDHGF